MCSSQAPKRSSFIDRTQAARRSSEQACTRMTDRFPPPEMKLTQVRDERDTKTVGRSTALARRGAPAR